MLLPGCPRQKKKLTLRAFPHLSLLHNGPAFPVFASDLTEKGSNCFKHLVDPSIVYIYV